MKIGQVGDVQIAIQIQGLNAEVWIQAQPGVREALEMMGIFGRLENLNGQGSWVVLSHSHELDRLIMELIDALISIRYAHPTLVQLPLTGLDL